MTPAPKPGVFRVGDRCRVRWAEGSVAFSRKGTLLRSNGFTWQVELEDCRQIWAHRCQIRKLVPRKRREWEMRGVHHDGPLIGCQPEWDFVVSGPKLREGETVRVREVKP